MVACGLPNNNNYASTRVQQHTIDCIKLFIYCLITSLIAPTLPLIKFVYFKRIIRFGNWAAWFRLDLVRNHNPIYLLTVQ